ncbi:hypothetical protein HPHPP15B_0017 [Helicobacter pylori Hp P-15b]|uniref:Uncharacterized protein n=1 Tax=Helicobacter pylori Hp P-15 TaxID=992080 RepID=J0F9V7_HELPX|nr:hypothetical protein HPHPP15_0014 [Helicobacter pylori Hp P-15]EJC33923.1 hypothetical protein HPHPP15B_0017 [Helicobacter pylori Hp P-15b]
MRYPNPLRTLLKSYHPIKIKPFLFFHAYDDLLVFQSP